MDKMRTLFSFLIFLSIYITCVPAVEKVMADAKTEIGRARADGVMADAKTEIGGARAEGDCTFGGITWFNGQKGFLLLGYCHKLKCVNGQWIILLIISDDCGKCILYDDPHYLNEDGAVFDFHHRCRIASLIEAISPVVQSNIGSEDHQTRRGVFTTFKDCTDGATPTCLWKTEVKFNFEVYIEFTHAATVNFKVIRGVGFDGGSGSQIGPGGTGDVNTFSDIAWMFHTAANVQNKEISVFCFRVTYIPNGRPPVICILCMTKYFSILICPRCLIIWYWKFLNQVLGLCGNFNEIGDEFTKPDGSTAADGNEFGLSWKTDVTDSNCEQRSKMSALMATFAKANKKNCKGIDGYLTQCQVAVDGHADRMDTTNKAVLVNACVEDVCATERHSRNDIELKEGINRWVGSIKDNAHIFNQNHVKKQKKL